MTPRWITRLRNRLIDGPFYALFGAAGTTMAMGAMTSQEQGLGSYIANGFRGIYEIPTKIVNTLRGARVVAQGAEEIYTTAEPATRDIGSLTDALQNVDITTPVKSVERIVGNYARVKETGPAFLDTLEKQEQALEAHVVRRVDELSDLLMNAVHNADDPLVWVVAGSFVAAGLTAGYFTARRVSHRLPVLGNIAGDERTTVTEDAIYLGKVVMQKAMNTLMGIGVLYALAEESMYTKLKTLKDTSFQQAHQLREAAETYLEQWKGYAHSLPARAKESILDATKSLYARGETKVREVVGDGVVDSLKEATGGAYEKIRTLFGSQPTEPVEREYVTMEHVKEAGGTLAERTQELYVTMQQVPDALQEGSGTEAYGRWMKRLWESDVWMTSQAAELWRAAQENRLGEYDPQQLAAALGDMAMNIAHHPYAATFVVASAAILAAVPPMTLYILANKVHDDYALRTEAGAKGNLPPPESHHQE